MFGEGERREFRDALLADVRRNRKKSDSELGLKLLEMGREKRGLWVSENLGKDCEEDEMIKELGRERRRAWERENSRST